MTFPLALINISLKLEFGKLLIEKEFAYLAYLGGVVKRISVINDPPNFAVQGQLCSTSAEIAYRSTPKNSPRQSHDSCLVIIWHKVGPRRLYGCIASWQINPISKGEGLKLGLTGI